MAEQPDAFGAGLLAQRRRPTDARRRHSRRWSPCSRRRSRPCCRTGRACRCAGSTRLWPASASASSRYGAAVDAHRIVAVAVGRARAGNDQHHRRALAGVDERALDRAAAAREPSSDRGCTRPLRRASIVSISPSLPSASASRRASSCAAIKCRRSPPGRATATMTSGRFGKQNTARPDDRERKPAVSAQPCQLSGRPAP